MFKFIFFITLLTFSLFAKESVSIDISYYLTKDNLSLSEIKTVDKFKVSNGENFGFTNKYCWLKINLLNSSKDEVKKYFKFEFQYIDHIFLYEDNLKEPKKYGQLESFDKKALSLKNQSFYINLNPKEQKTIYLKLKSTLPLKTKIQTFEDKEYIKNLLFYKQIYAFVYGILIVMIIYNFIIYLNIKERAYLYYVLFHLVFLFAIFAFSGLGFEILWAEYPIVNLYIYGVVSNLLCSLDYMLIIYFLDTKKYLPKTTSILKSLAMLSLFLALTSPFLALIKLYEINTMLTETALILVMIYLTVFKKVVVAKYLLIAKLSLFLGVIVLVFSEFGFITDTFFIDNAYILGIVIELILMSFVLSYKYKDEKFKHKLERQKRVQTEKILITKHKLSILGEMFNNVVHQWRQPLSQINSIIFSIESEYNLNSLNRKNLEDKLNNIENLTHYLSQSINDFKNFSESSKLEKFKISSLIKELLTISDFSIKVHKIDIKIKYSDKNIYLSSSRNELVQVLMIILNNAKDALIEAKIKEPKIIIEVSEDSESIYITVGNNGGEIEEKLRDKIFEPNFSTKSKSGMGIGLYIAKKIVNKLNGSIIFYNSNNWVYFKINFTKKSQKF